MPLKEVSYRGLSLNPMTLFANDWAALAAGTEGDSNAMCIAWGQLGTLFERGKHTNRLPVATVYVRPSRYTHGFMDRKDTFSISFFDRAYKKSVAYLGSHSGRDGDKYAPAGLTPVYADDTTYFEEANLVFVCHKLYAAPLTKEGFTDPELYPFNYPNSDVHTMYVGQIVKVLQQ